MEERETLEQQRYSIIASCRKLDEELAESRPLNWNGGCEDKKIFNQLVCIFDTTLAALVILINKD